MGAGCIPVILQPVTPFGRVKTGPSVDDLMDWSRILGEADMDVRVIPQTHRSYGAL